MMNLCIKMALSSFIVWIALLAASLPLRDAWMQWLDPKWPLRRVYTFIEYTSFAVCIISVVLIVWLTNWTAS